MNKLYKIYEIIKKGFSLLKIYTSFWLLIKTTQNIKADSNISPSNNFLLDIDIGIDINGDSNYSPFIYYNLPIKKEYFDYNVDFSLYHYIPFSYYMPIYIDVDFKGFAGLSPYLITNFIININFDYNLVNKPAYYSNIFVPIELEKEIDFKLLYAIAGIFIYNSFYLSIESPFSIINIEDSLSPFNNFLLDIEDGINYYFNSLFKEKLDFAYNFNLEDLILNLDVILSNNIVNYATLNLSTKIDISVSSLVKRYAKLYDYSTSSYTLGTMGLISMENLIYISD